MKLKPAEMGEALSLAVSIILVFSLIVYLAAAIVKRSDIPHLAIVSEAQSAVAVQGGYIIPVTVRNMGERTVSFAAITVKLPGREAEIEVAYLPRQSTRDVYLFADRPYAQNQILLRTSYYKLD